MSACEFDAVVEARGFVDPLTTIAEVGTVRVLDNTGKCVNCGLEQKDQEKTKNSQVR